MTTITALRNWEVLCCGPGDGGAAKRRFQGGTPRREEGGQGSGVGEGRCPKKIGTAGRTGSGAAARGRGAGRGADAGAGGRGTEREGTPPPPSLPQCSKGAKPMEFEFL